MPWERELGELFKASLLPVAALARFLGVTYPTARADLQRLEKVGIVRQLKGASPLMFYSPEVFDVAYAGMEQP